MADALLIKSGTKLRIALDSAVGTEPKFNLVSTFNKALDESAFLISIPMTDGKPMPIDETKKLLIRYGTDVSGSIIAGYADDIVKEGIRSFWKIRRVTEQRQFFHRSDERVKVSLPLTYLQDTWPSDSDGIIHPDDGFSLDISAGGIAAYLSHHFQVGEICMISLPRLGTIPAGLAIENIVSVACWEREAPKGSPFRNICGFQFRFPSGSERDRLFEYVSYVKKKYAL